MSVRHLVALVCDGCGQRVEQRSATVSIPAGWGQLHLALDETRAIGTDGAPHHLCPRCVPTLTPPQLEADV